MANKGGVKGSLTSGFILMLILGGIFGWMKVNNIRDVGGAWDYFHALSNKTADCSSGEKLNWHCKTKITDGDISSGGNNNSNIDSKDYTIDSSGNVKVKNPVDSKTGSKISLPSNINVTPPTNINGEINSNGVNTTTPLALLHNALNHAKIANPTKVAYKRSEWKHWIGEPCNTRNIVLIKQGKNVKVNKTAHSCKIISGEWTSPYDEKKVTESEKLDIDHVSPLSYVAMHGGQSWSPDKKEKFANDTNQLIAVTENANRSKGDKGPSEYMPTDSFKCNYSKIWVQNINKYGFTITAKDKATLNDGLNMCN